MCSWMTVCWTRGLSRQLEVDSFNFSVKNEAKGSAVLRSRRRGRWVMQDFKGQKVASKPYIDCRFSLSCVSQNRMFVK